MRNFKSTRGSEKKLTAAKAIIQGIAEDKGLYVPEEIPCLPCGIDELVNMSYQEIAKLVIGTFFDDYTSEEMNHCVNSAYDSKFEEAEIAPIIKANDAFFLELYHGKTAAFKDMALSILPYLLTTALKKEKEEKKICILTATSGDTGKAALEGFADVEGTEIIVFYPNSGVSQVQERQMITQVGENTHVFAIEGNFDDAQTGVKRIFGNEAFAEKLAEKNIKLSSANSINIGRLVPQVAYYVYSYAQLVKRGVLKNGEPMNVVVPTGNFGNILAAYYAMKMGIPVHKFICASNENKVLTDFINTGVYDIHRDFYLTNSPSMDILISSNLERLLYHLSGCNGAEVKDLMNQLEANKCYTVSPEIKEGLVKFYGGYASEEETKSTIEKMYSEYKYLMDTHTAVAYKVYSDYKNETGDDTPTIIASTASAYKFAESVATSIGVTISEDTPDAEKGFRYLDALSEATEVRVPKGLQGLEDKEIRHNTVIEVSEMMNTVFDTLK